MGTTPHDTRPGRPTTTPVVDRRHRSYQGHVSASDPAKMDTAASDPASPSHQVRNWVHPDRRRGRGALSNVSGRFETQAREVVDDGWGTIEEAPRLPTQVTVEQARKIITKNQSPDLPFDRSINPYRGCEHGCTYCFARPTHAYMGLSPGLDFESKLFAKPNAAALLEKELSHPTYRVKPIAIGTNTDPYQPIERRYRIMRSVLEVLSKHNHPVTIVTKSALVIRDLDLLTPMAERGLLKVALSVTTLDGKLARALEPRASQPAKRMDALRLLSEAGIPTALMVAPVIPGLTDHELEKIVMGAHYAGVKQAGYVLLRMPHEIKDLFKEWLHENVPDRAERVLKLIRSTRNGKNYDAQWGQRMRGEGPYAWLLKRRFDVACQRHGMGRHDLHLECDLFTPPKRPAKQTTTAPSNQMDLF